MRNALELLKKKSLKIEKKFLHFSQKFRKLHQVKRSHNTHFGNTSMLPMLYKVLMSHFGITANQAWVLINDAKRRIADRTATYDILRSEFNVDPDLYWLEIAPESAIRLLHD
jgi:hypothetical protein